MTPTYKNIITVLIIITLCTILYLFISSPKDQAVDLGPIPVVYNNADYGFTFSLPDNWKGYSIVKNKWEGNSAKATANETGPKLLIRNPKWTSAVPYEDIPVLVFTIAQWNSYKAEEFSVSAAPFQASELARNNRYVFALPPRWDFDYSKDYEEAQNIVKMNPLKTYSL